MKKKKAAGIVDGNMDVWRHGSESGINGEKYRKKVNYQRTRRRQQVLVRRGDEKMYIL